MIRLRRGDPVYWINEYHAVHSGRFLRRRGRWLRVTWTSAGWPLTGSEQWLHVEHVWRNPEDAANHARALDEMLQADPNLALPEGNSNG